MKKVNEYYDVLKHEDYTFIAKKVGLNKNGNMMWQVIVISGNMHLGTWSCQAYTSLEAMEKVLCKLKRE